MRLWDTKWLTEINKTNNVYSPAQILFHLKLMVDKWIAYLLRMHKNYGHYKINLRCHHSSHHSFYFGFSFQLRTLMKCWNVDKSLLSSQSIDFPSISKFPELKWTRTNCIRKWNERSALADASKTKQIKWKLSNETVISKSKVQVQAQAEPVKFK